MWLLFHRKAGTKTVAGGKSFSDECPTCARTTHFREVEVSEQLGVWFVDVVGDTERAFRCERCGDVFDLRDESGSRAAPLEVEPAPHQLEDRTAARAAEQRLRDEAVAARAVRIEDELAELKKRLGR